MILVILLYEYNRLFARIGISLYRMSLEFIAAPNNTSKAKLPDL